MPLPVIGDLLCSKGAKTGDGGSVDEDKVQAELSQLSNALTRVPIPLPTSALSPALGALNNAPGVLNNAPGALSNAPGVLNNAPGALSNAPGALNNVSSVVSGMVPGNPSNSSRVDEASPPTNGSAIASSDIYGSSSMASMSSTSLWRAQPTPANSPSLPIDSSPSQSTSSNPVSASTGSTNTTAAV